MCLKPSLCPVTDIKKKKTMKYWSVVSKEGSRESLSPLLVQILRPEQTHRCFADVWTVRPQTD